MQSQNGRVDFGGLREKELHHVFLDALQKLGRRLVIWEKINKNEIFKKAFFIFTKLFIRSEKND